MTRPTEPRSPLADAVEWVGRITVIALEMVLPGLAGQWLDERYGLNFLALVGFAFGLTAALWHLLAMTREAQQRNDAARKRPPEDPSS